MQDVSRMCRCMRFLLYKELTPVRRRREVWTCPGLRPWRGRTCGRGRRRRLPPPPRTRAARPARAPAHPHIPPPEGVTITIQYHCITIQYVVSPLNFEARKQQGNRRVKYYRGKKICMHWPSYSQAVKLSRAWKKFLTTTYKPFFSALYLMVSCNLVVIALLLSNWYSIH